MTKQLISTKIIPPFVYSCKPQKLGMLISLMGRLTPEEVIINKEREFTTQHEQKRGKPRLPKKLGEVSEWGAVWPGLQVIGSLQRGQRHSHNDSKDIHTMTRWLNHRDCASTVHLRHAANFPLTTNENPYKATCHDVNRCEQSMC